jgi:hypothetical protein
MFIIAYVKNVNLIGASHQVFGICIWKFVMQTYGTTYLGVLEFTYCWSLILDTFCLKDHNLLSVVLPSNLHIMFWKFELEGAFNVQ